MKVLAIDVGGTNIKLLATGHEARRKFPSGPEMTAKQMVYEVRKIAGDWQYDVVSIGYPGVVFDNHILTEPYNLGKGWAGFNFEHAFGRPVRIINDAAMQALGSYKGGRMLFLGLGTGLGSAMIIDGQLQPMELAHLPYRKGTYEDYVGLRGMLRFGKKKWRRYVEDVVGKLASALEPDDIVLGGGNVKFLKSLPPKCRAGSNLNAFVGGYRLWDDTSSVPTHPAPPHPASIGSHRTGSKKRVNGKDSRA